MGIRGKFSSVQPQHLQLGTDSQSRAPESRSLKGRLLEFRARDQRLARVQRLVPGFQVHLFLAVQGEAFCQALVMGIGTLVMAALAGWINRQQQDVIEYLQEEVRVLRESQGKKRLRFSDDQRKRLAYKAKRLGLSRLKEIAAIVSPQTLLA